MIDLNIAVKEIREIIYNKQQELQLSFIESTHTYFIKDKNDIIRNDFPSVSTLIENFYEPFDSESKSFEKAKGDLEKQQELLEEWANSGSYATNMGSRAHYELEKETVSRYGNYKNLREPEFVVDNEQITKSDKMIIAGKSYLDLMMHKRNAVLLDTELLLGSIDLGYVGTPDKLWLALNKNKDKIYLYCTDWKTNQPKNFIPQWFTKNLYPPFDEYPSTALEHYYIQLPLYVRLFLDMLKGSKYEKLELGGCIVVLLKDDETFTEYRVPEKFITTLLTMDLTDYLKPKEKVKIKSSSSFIEDMNELF